MDIYNNLKEIQKYCSEHNHKFNIEELARLTTKERDILKFIEEYDNKVRLQIETDGDIDFDKLCTDLERWLGVTVDLISEVENY